MKKKQPAEQSTAAQGRFAYEGLDRVMHEKARLGILVSLSARSDGLLFGELKELCSLTDGNLNRHLDVLAGEKLIEIQKRFEAKRPQTRVRISARGRKRFLEYVAELERVVRDAQVESEAATSKPRFAPA